MAVIEAGNGRRKIPPSDCVSLIHSRVTEFLEFGNCFCVFQEKQKPGVPNLESQAEGGTEDL